MKWPVVIEKDPESGHYVGEVIGLDVIVQGDTKAETLSLLKEGIAVHLGYLRSKGLVARSRAELATVEV